MKPIENVFNFNCSECEYNRNCYGGNLGNQFRYCRKSTEKIEEIEKLQQENTDLRIQISAREEEYLKLESLVDTILDFDLLREDCPLGYDFEKNSIECIVQDEFYEEEYCEENCDNDSCKKCWLKFFKRVHELYRGKSA